MANEEMNNPVDKAQNMEQEDKNQILESYDRFVNYLGDQVGKGEKLGMDEDQLAKSAKKVADYLSKNEEPRNREEKVLKEVWTVAENDDEKQNFARLLVRLADKNG